jgi:hypothetical protein
MNPRRRLTLPLLAALTAALASGWTAGALPAASTSPTVTWSPSSLELTVQAGQSTSAIASFTASKKLTSVKITANPGISGFVTPSPASLSSVNAGTPVSVSLSVSVPLGTAPGDYDGVVQVSAAGKNQAKPLPVTLHVSGIPTTLTTSLSATSIGTGASVSDQATIQGAPANAGGTITYTVYSDSGCQTQYADATPTTNTVTNASAPASKAVTFSSAGTYYWQAVYSGDPATSTLGSTSDCGSEQLTVTSCAIGCPWLQGDLLTYGQGDWGGTGTAANLLANDYNTVYTSTGGLFDIGDASKYYIEFTSASALQAYLPQGGTAGVLNGILLDPTTSASGAFGGDVAALKLNIDFADAGLLSASSGLKFGDLLLCNISSPSGLSGMTVRQFLATANTVLGATSTAYTAADLDALAIDVNYSFRDGTPSTFAQDHLVNGACP